MSKSENVFFLACSLQCNFISFLGVNENDRIKHECFVQHGLRRDKNSANRSYFCTASPNQLNNIFLIADEFRYF